MKAAACARVTEDSRLAVLDILACEWPLCAAEVGWRLYPEGDRWAPINRQRAMRILRVLEAEGKVKPWEIRSSGTPGWASADAPSFEELWRSLAAVGPEDRRRTKGP
jgi:hypothetical protein